MKTSARNQLACKVTTVKTGAVNDSIDLQAPGGQKLVATITRESTRYLGLEAGKDAVALIKASSVIVALPDPAMKLSARNLLVGKVGQLTPGAVNAEVGIELEGGGTLTAIITLESAHDLGLEQGTQVIAVIKASMVILGTAA
ncbi:MAG: TOBE domain-containing protein [Rhodanobacter sp.]